MKKSMKKEPMELVVKINLVSVSGSFIDRKDSMKDFLKEMQKIRKKHPDIKIYAEVIR